MDWVGSVLLLLSGVTGTFLACTGTSATFLLPVGMFLFSNYTLANFLIGITLRESVGLLLLIFLNDLFSENGTLSIFSLTDK